MSTTDQYAAYKAIGTLDSSYEQLRVAATVLAHLVREEYGQGPLVEVARIYSGSDTAQLQALASVEALLDEDTYQREKRGERA